jgi:hypothetical protein
MNVARRFLAGFDANRVAIYKQRLDFNRDRCAWCGFRMPLAGTVEAGGVGQIAKSLWGGHVFFACAQTVVWRLARSGTSFMMEVTLTTGRHGQI